MPAPAGYPLPLLHQTVVGRGLLCLLPQQQRRAMPDFSVKPDAAGTGHNIAAYAFAAPGPADHSDFSCTLRFWGIAGALQLRSRRYRLRPPERELELVAHGGKGLSFPQKRAWQRRFIL